MCILPTRERFDEKLSNLFMLDYEYVDNVVSRPLRNEKKRVSSMLERRTNMLSLFYE